MPKKNKEVAVSVDEVNATLAATANSEFADLLDDLDESYKNLGASAGKKFITAEQVEVGFEGVYLGREKVESQFGPTVHWRFNVGDEECVLNRPSSRADVRDNNKVKPTRFLVSFMNAKPKEGDKLFIKASGKGYAIQYEIKKI